MRNYRLYAGGQLASNTGTWMQRTAQDWLVVELTHGSGTALGTTMALQFLPMLLFGLWGGVIADRFPKRRILMVTRASMGVVSLILGLLVLTGGAHLWHIYALAFGLGLITTVDNPSRQSFVVEIVGREHVPNAVALNSATFNTGRVLGPAVAGLLIGFVGMSPVLLLSAATYVGMLAGLGMMRERQLYAAEPVRKGRGRVREGLRYVRGSPVLLLPIIIGGVLGTFAFNFQLMIALMAKHTFGRGASEFGLLSSALAVGALVGALLAARRRQASQRAVVGAAVAFGVLAVVSGLMPTYIAFMLLLIPVGICTQMFGTSANAFLQLRSAPAVRGRVMALYVMVFLGGKPLGAPLMGWVGETLGARFTLIIGGLLSMTVAVVVAAVLARAQGLSVRPHALPRPHVDVVRPL